MDPGLLWRGETARGGGELFQHPDRAAQPGGARHVCDRGDIVGQRHQQRQQHRHRRHQRDRRAARSAHHRRHRRRFSRQRREDSDSVHCRQRQRHARLVRHAILERCGLAVPRQHLHPEPRHLPRLRLARQWRPRRTGQLHRKPGGHAAAGHRRRVLHLRFRQHPGRRSRRYPRRRQRLDPGCIQPRRLRGRGGQRRSGDIARHL